MSQYAPKDINHWVGTGNLTRDPEVREFDSGNAVTTLRIACNSGGPKDAPYPTLYVNVDVWNGQGKACADYLRKGRGVIVEGRLEIKDGEKDGVKLVYPKIVASTVKFDRGGKTTEVEVAPAADASDDDIPF